MDFKEIWKRTKGFLIFGILYLGTFFFIESRNVPIHIIHTALDDRIPFCEYFIVPYVLWFLFIAGTLVYLGLTDKTLKEYNRFICSMALGMLVFVIVSFIYPNGQNLRPVIESDNVFKWAVNFLYEIDTSTNILPSLHVYASVVCDTALSRDARFKKHPSWRWASHILTILIILSTMFLKQHSVVDVIAALLCNIVFYPVVYHWEFISARLSGKASRKVIHS